jgi:hypothetical protein
MPKQQVDLSTSPPRFYFDAADRAFLADPSNYYWGSAQEHRDHATATQKAWRGDAKFTFDHPVLNDVRFGVRLTERKAVTDSTHDSEWAQITAPWTRASPATTACTPSTTSSTARCRCRRPWSCPTRRC